MLIQPKGMTWELRSIGSRACEAIEKAEPTNHSPKREFGRIITTVGWDLCPVRLFVRARLFVRDNGPKLRLVCFSLPLA